MGAKKYWMVLNNLFHTDYISQEGKIMDFLKCHADLDNKVIEMPASHIKTKPPLAK